MPQFMTFFFLLTLKKIFLRYAQPCFCRSMIIMFHVKYISWGDGMYQRATFEQNKHVLTCVDIVLHTVRMFVCLLSFESLTPACKMVKVTLKL